RLGPVAGAGCGLRAGRRGAPPRGHSLLRVTRGSSIAMALAISALGAPATAAGALPPLDAGVGRADITPPTGYYMQGWVRSDAKTTGQHTRLWARVIVLKRGSHN